MTPQLASMLELPGLSSGRVYNFSAGPGTLPESVLKQIQEDTFNIRNSGIGILEHSHRGPVVDRIFEEAEADCREVGSVPNNYKVLFLTGGATTQCFMVPLNLLPDGARADYLQTGKWATDSIEDARLYGDINVAWSAKDSNFDHLPQSNNDIKHSDNPVYLHFTSNNTIYGSEFRFVPQPKNKDAFVVCDASSNIFSRPIDFTKYGLVYAGAQKNLGPAGTTVMWIREDLLQRCPRKLPPMLSYAEHAKAGSRYNTPPVFPIYVVGLIFKWIREQGGLTAMQKHNETKAKYIYDVLDSSSFYKGHVRPDSRSLMNITFKTPTPDLDKKFLTESEKAGLDGLKGHRSTGGMRASIYNAMPKEGCKALADFMKEFERTNG